MKSYVLFNYSSNSFLYLSLSSSSSSESVQFGKSAITPTFSIFKSSILTSAIIYRNIKVNIHVSLFYFVLRGGGVMLIKHFLTILYNGEINERPNNQQHLL